MFRMQSPPEHPIDYTTVDALPKRIQYSQTGNTVQELAGI